MGRANVQGQKRASCVQGNWQHRMSLESKGRTGWNRASEARAWALYVMSNSPAISVTSSRKSAWLLLSSLLISLNSSGFLASSFLHSALLHC